MLVNFEEDNQQETWKRIWKFRGHIKTFLLLWIIKQSGLITRKLLFKRNIVESPLCPICYKEEETILHALRDCRKVKEFGKSNIWSIEAILK